MVSKSSQYPSTWDPRIADLATAVERERELDFEHPVHVDFMTEADFKDKVTAPSSEQSDEDTKEMQQAVELFRAFGLLQGEVNLLEQSNTLRQGGTLALYDPKSKHVFVRGTDLDVAHKVTIVHELTHALQDQHFDLTRLSKLPTDDERVAFRTVIEGDAVRIERQYVARLSESDRSAYEAQEKSDSDQAKKDVSSVPDVLIASFAAPYEFGAPFLRLLEAKGGNAEVNAALQSPPSGEGQIIDPQDFFQKRSTVDVGEPSLPQGAEKVILDPSKDSSSETERLGVLDFMLMLSARVDAHQALKAADVWRGDALVAYRDRGKLCAKVAVVADSGAASTLAPILDEWKQDMPSEAHAAIEQSDDRFDITTCDPGSEADARIEGKPSEAFALPAVRLYVFASAIEGKQPLARSECIAKYFTDHISVQEATNSELGEDVVRGRISEAKGACP